MTILLQKTQYWQGSSFESHAVNSLISFSDFGFLKEQSFIVLNYLVLDKKISFSLQEFMSHGQEQLSTKIKTLSMVT